jgi:arylsulfatase A-like enzyme
MAKRPNFLLFITDQQRADHVGCYGNPILKTPGIDRIGKRGVRFDRFHVASPVCMPNRATLMTGRMPSLHGVRFNGVPLSLRSNTFVELMRVAGWRTALVGKSHLQNLGGLAAVLERPATKQGLKPPPAGLNEAMKDDPGPYAQEDRVKWREPGQEIVFPYYGFERMDLCVGHGSRVHGSYGLWLEERHSNADSLRGPENQLPGNTYSVPQAWRTRIPEELYPTTYVAEKTIEFLEAHAKKGGDAPFMVQCSFPDPHHPFTPPGKYWDMYKPEDMPLPPSYDAKGGPPPPYVAKLQAERDNGTRKGDTQAAFAVTPREAKEAIALTYGMISMIDAGVARVLDRLEQLGLADDTVVMFTSDHGDMMGDHQLLLKGQLAYRGLVRVPFLWADPKLDRSRAGASTDALCGTLDIAASILERAGLAPYNGMQGRSLLSAIDGTAKQVRDAVLIEYGSQRSMPGVEGETVMRTLVTDQYRITYYRGAPWGELYDLERDPHEMHNLWDDESASRVKKDMTELLLREMLSMAETSPLPKALA